MRRAGAGNGDVRGGDGLARALLASVPGFVLPWLLARFVVPAFAEAGRALPAFTAAWLKLYPLAFALPVAVFATWWWLRAHPLRDRVALGVGAGGSLLVDGASVAAAWLPVAAAPALA